jgi:hypothetical protein
MDAAPNLTDEAIDAIATAVFDPPDAWVAEAYSDFDVPPRQFRSAIELTAYAKERLSKSRGSASFFVTYPDTGGRAVLQTIHIKAGNVPGKALRYTWEGWGLISVVLTRGDQPNDVSRITANSEKRAAKWASTYPTWDPVSTWNWKAVAKHSRRLQRVLDRNLLQTAIGDRGQILPPSAHTLGSLLPTDILARVQNDFAEKEVGEAVELLATYSGPECDRLRRCAIHLSAGILERLRHHLQTAAVDHRDVILFAEYDSENRRIHDFSRGFNGVP